MNVIIGQYYPVDSVIHRLDSRVKLLSTIAFITIIFFVHTFLAYAVAAACLLVVIRIAKVPIGLVLRGLRGVLFVVLFTVVLNVFFSQGERVIFSFGVIRLTYEGVVFAAKMAVRIVLLILGSSVLTLTTSPIELTDAIEYILKPFKKIGVPSSEIAMMMTIALRFIPTLMDELNKIRKAQMARGADFDTGGITKKAKSLIPLLVPLFISSFRRADELAMAMEARCYRGDVNRTRMKQLKLTKIDLFAVMWMMIFCAALIGVSL